MWDSASSLSCSCGILHLIPVIALAVSPVIRGLYSHSLFPGLSEFLQFLDKPSGLSVQVLCVWRHQSCYFKS